VCSLMPAREAMRGAKEREEQPALRACMVFPVATRPGLVNASSGSSKVTSARACTEQHHASAQNFMCASNPPHMPFS
jgi:hypothetical protein